MSMLRQLLALAIVLVAAPVAAEPVVAAAQENRGTEEERSEIARILEADNLDAGSLTPREVASQIAAIPRGRAPEDFWSAYQEHVRAWRLAAEAQAKLEDLADGKRGGSEQVMAEADEALSAIETTFSEVERIAASYGVPMPTPPALIENFDPDTV